jgi:hypothetical protein
LQADVERTRINPAQATSHSEILSRWLNMGQHCRLNTSAPASFENLQAVAKTSWCLPLKIGAAGSFL